MIKKGFLISLLLSGILCAKWEFGLGTGYLFPAQNQLPAFQFNAQVSNQLNNLEFGLGYQFYFLDNSFDQPGGKKTIHSTHNSLNIFSGYNFRYKRLEFAPTIFTGIERIYIPAFQVDLGAFGEREIAASVEYPIIYGLSGNVTFLLMKGLKLYLTTMYKFSKEQRIDQSFALSGGVNIALD